MLSRRILPFMALAAFTLFGVLAPQEDALAVRRPGKSAERTIVFQAPGLIPYPAIWLDKWLREGLSIGSETIVWEDFNSRRANALVEYWDNRPYEVLRVGGVKEIPKSFGFDIEFVGDIKKADSVFGKVDYIRAKTASNKNCVIFLKIYRVTEYTSPKRRIHGWYCSAVGEPLSDDVIRSAIASLGVKGWKVPESPESDQNQ